MTTSPPEISPKKAEVVMNKISTPPAPRDDLDIRQKLKELEMAKLERQIHL